MMESSNFSYFDYCAYSQTKFFIDEIKNCTRVPTTVKRAKATATKEIKPSELKTQEKSLTNLNQLSTLNKNKDQRLDLDDCNHTFLERTF